MTDDEVTQAVQQIKATASPAGGALAERLGDEILSLKAKRKLVFDAWELDRNENEAFKKALADIGCICKEEHPDNDLETQEEFDADAYSRKVFRIQDIVESVLKC